MFRILSRGYSTEGCRILENLRQQYQQKKTQPVNYRQGHSRIGYTSPDEM